MFATISREHQHLEAGTPGVKYGPAPASLSMSLEQLGRWLGRAVGPIPGAACSALTDVSGSPKHLTPPRTRLWERLPEGNYLENRSCAVKCSIDAKRAEQCVLQNVSSSEQYPQAVGLFTLGSLFPLSYLLWCWHRAESSGTAELEQNSKCSPGFLFLQNSLTPNLLKGEPWAKVKL